MKLTQWHFPKPIGILTAALLGFSVFIVIGGIVSVQLVHLAQDMPQYQTNIRQKLKNFKESTPKIFSRISQVTDALEKETFSGQASGNDKEVEIKPTPVVIHQSVPLIFYQITNVFSFLLGPLGVGILVTIFVISILFNREDLRERFITLVSRGNLNLATQVIDDAAKRITKYLLMNLIVNAVFGIIVGLGLYFIGVPNPVLWGLLATFLRFIPFLGIWIAAAFPVLLAFAIMIQAGLCFS